MFDPYDLHIPKYQKEELPKSVEGLTEFFLGELHNMRQQMTIMDLKLQYAITEVNIVKIRYGEPQVDIDDLLDDEAKQIINEAIATKKKPTV